MSAVSIRSVIGIQKGHAESMAITNYNAYLKQLENIYNQYGFSVSDAILRDFIVRERLDVNFKITVQDLRKDLTTIHNRNFTRTPASPQSRPAQQPAQKPVAPTRQAVIKTYPEYMAALEKLYISNGKVILTDAEIQNFITTNKIDVAFGVTKADVKKDLQTIDAKWHPSMPKPKPQPNPTRTYTPPKPKAKLTTYKQYMDALESLYVQNGKVLTDAQLTKFIVDNAIDTGFGVKLFEVKKDLQDIEKKLNAKIPILITSYEKYERELSDFVTQNGDKSFLDLYIKKFISSHGMDIKNPTLMSDIRMDLVLVQAKMPLSSATAKGLKDKAMKVAVSDQNMIVDDKFKSDFAAIILKHKEAISNTPSIKGLLWDYFPDKKREINVLMLLAGYGMLDDMRFEKTLGSVFISKYVNRIVNEYGIDKHFANEMALVWCHGYGVCLLGKKLIIK